MIKINDTEVKAVKIKKKVNILEYLRKPEDGDAKFKMVDAINYTYFACTCKDIDENYFKDLMLKEFPEQDGLVSTSLIYSLLGEGWYVSGCSADQWMGVTISNETNSDSMYIQCDFFEYGLLAAYLIAKELSGDEE